MRAQPSHRKKLEQNLGELIQALELPDLQKQLLHSRWLDQVLWMEGAARRNLIGYRALRLTAIVGGVLVPVLISLSVAFEITVGISLLVAISSAVEEFFHFGERWRHYRRTVEFLKSEGWQLFQKSGRYQGYEHHAEAYPVFAAQVEIISQQEVEVYITQVVREEEKKEKEKKEVPETL